MPSCFQPKDFLPFTTVQNRFYARRDSGQWEQIVSVLVMAVHEAEGREAAPSIVIVERTFGWINRASRLAKDFEPAPPRSPAPAPSEALVSSSQAWLMLALAFLLVRRIARDYKTPA
jgi:hypothetical protein